LGLKVVISHPGRQHSHQTAYALQEGDMLAKYFTSCWYKPKLFPFNLLMCLPDCLKEKIRRPLHSRYFRPLDPQYVHQMPAYEIFGRIRNFLRVDRHNQTVHWINSKFDKYISKKLKKLKFDIFIGYEDATLDSFTTAKKLGKFCILDLAISHFSFESKFISRCGESDLEPISEDIIHRKTLEIELADLIFVPSRFVKRTLVESNVPESKIRIIPYGYDNSIFQPKETYNDTKTFTVLFVGSAIHRKGVPFLLKAFKELQLEHAKMVIVGGADFKLIAADISNRNPSIIFNPFIPQSELAEYYHSADIFVLPSLFEGMAQVVLEAMACGTPVIITSNTGLEDIVREGTEGFYVPIRDVDAIKQKILFFYHNRSEIERMGKNAALRVQEFTWQRYRQCLLTTIISDQKMSR